jgi:hypothetical protein
LSDVDLSGSGPRFLQDGISDDLLYKVVGGELNPSISLASNIAKGLALDENKALKALFSFTEKRFKNSGGHVLQMHSLLSTLYLTGSTHEEVWRWTSLALDAIYQQGIQFATISARDFEQAMVRNISAARRINGNRATPIPVKFVASTSASTEFSKYARAKKGCSVILQVSPHGTRISTDQKLGIDLVEVTQAFRAEENRIQRRSIPGDPEILGSTGTLANCPEWHFPEHRGELHNGTLTKSAPKSRIPMERRPELVQIGLDVTLFEPSRAKHCRAGHCVSSLHDPCPWYDYKFHRCRQIRFNRKMKLEQQRTGR